MRRLLGLTVIALVLAAPPASPQPVDEAWSDDGTLLEIGEFDGQQSDDILFWNPATVRIELRDVVTGGTLFTYPNKYGSNALLLTLAHDLDGDPSDELVMYSCKTGNPIDGRLGLFDVIDPAAPVGAEALPGPFYGARWDVPYTNGFASALMSADFEGTGYRSIIVVGNGTFTIHAFSDGQKIYDWQTDGTPFRNVSDIQVVDLDHDGREELLVTTLPDFPGGGPFLHVIRSTLPLSAGGPATIETRLLAAQNAPNPFDGPTRIAFTLPVRERVSVDVYDAAGRRVRTVLDEVRAPGSHQVTWDGRDDAGHQLRSGVYFYEVRAGDDRQTRKMLRIR